MAFENQGADEHAPLVPELSAVPAGPGEGEAPPEQDSAFILSTLFGQDDKPAESKAKPAGDQGPGAKPAGGEPSAAAPAAVAPAAKEGGTAPPVEQPPVPGVPPLQPATEQKPAGGTQPQTQGPGQQPAPSEQPPAQSGLSPEDRLAIANAKALAEQNQQLLAEIRRMQGGQTQPADQTQSGQQPQQPGVPQEQVHLAVPDDLYKAVFAEDETTSRRGMNTLVSAVATAAVNTVLSKVQPMIADALKGYDQTLSSKSSAQAQEQDYYGAFPSHKNDLFLPVIQREIGLMQNEMPNAVWSEDYRNALGARVNRTLQTLGFAVGMVPGQQQQNGQQPTTQGFGAQQKPQEGAPPEKPPVMLDPGSRPAASDGPENFIAATFA